MDSQQHIAYQFDSYCKKILKYHARDYTAKQRRVEQERNHCEFSEELAELEVVDRYFEDTYHFCVLDYDISITGEALAEALKALPADRRDIILLSFYLDMPDREIAERMNLVRRTVAYRRDAALQKLRKILEGQANEQQKYAAKTLIETAHSPSRSYYRR